MGTLTASGKVRLMATVEPEVAAHIEGLAAAMGMSVSKLLGILLGVAVQAGGGTFEAFADDLARLQGKGE